jgi:hypothetical protein
MTSSDGTATGRFTIKAWDERPWAELEGAPKLTRTHVTAGYGGDLEGEGTGTGDLAGLRGGGGYAAKQGEPEVAFELRWSLG